MRTLTRTRLRPIPLRAAITFVALAALFVACSDRSDTAGLPPAQADDSPEVFLDGYAPGLTFQAFLDSKYDAALIDANDAAAGTNSSLQITVPGPSATPPYFAGGAFTSEWVRDLTGYNALTFYAKSERPTTLNEVGMGIYFGSRPTKEYHKMAAFDIPMTTEWVKHVIPIPDPSKLVYEAGLFWFSEGYEGTGYKFWLDEIKYEYVPGIGNARPTMTSDTTMSTFVGWNVIPEGTQVTMAVGSEDILIAHAPGYYTYTVSDPGVLKANEDGTLTAVGSGTATVTAKLGTVDVLGSMKVRAASLPTVAATPPTAHPDSVISVFSGVYQDVRVHRWMADWAVGDEQRIAIAGDSVWAYTSLGYAVIEPSNTIDASSMTHYHIDVWAPGGTSIIIKLVDFGADGKPGVTTDPYWDRDTEHALTLDDGTTPVYGPGRWVSLDIPMSQFSNLRQTAHIAQLIVEGVNSVLVDNIYFHK